MQKRIFNQLGSLNPTEACERLIEAIKAAVVGSLHWAKQHNERDPDSILPLPYPFVWPTRHQMPGTDSIISLLRRRADSDAISTNPFTPDQPQRLTAHQFVEKYLPNTNLGSLLNVVDQPYYQAQRPPLISNHHAQN